MRKIAGMLIASLFFLSTLYAEEPQYTNYSFPRLSYVTGKTYLQRAADLAYEEGIVNMPISEGDRLGTTDGRAEIFLGKGNYIRLNNNTKIDFLNLPKKGDELVRIRILLGNVYFRVESLEEEKNIEIHTPDVSFYVLDKGLYRIDVREEAETEIFVFKGMVEAAGESGSVLIKDEQRLEISNGRFISRPSGFHAVTEDSFDRWSEFRDSQVRKRLEKTYLPEELEDFEHELADNGYWAYVPPYGYVWVPRGMAPDWRPYYYGRWSWLPLCGWTWIPFEPWGWCTYHYGRWHWGIGLGWYWIPTPIWGPAWVNWYWGYDYFGWVPLSYYGYPGVFINNVYYGRYTGRYYPYDSRAITVIHKNQLKARNISKVALNSDSIKSLRKIRLSSLQQPVKPSASRIAVEKLGEKKLLLWKSNRRPEAEKRKRTDRAPIQKKERTDLKSIEKKAARSAKPAQERKITQKKPSSKSRGSIKKQSYGYPSSPKISIKDYPRRISPKKSSSLLGRIYKSITGSKRSIIKNRSSRGSSRITTSKKSSSRSRSSSVSSRRSSSSSRKSSSSSRSSRSSSRSSGKVRKKK